MQTLKDAATILVLLLLIASVRIAPAEKMALIPEAAAAVPAPAPVTGETGPGPALDVEPAARPRAIYLLEIETTVPGERRARVRQDNC